MSLRQYSDPINAGFLLDMDLEAEMQPTNRQRVVIYNEFCNPAGGTLLAPWGTTTTGTPAAPNFVTGAIDGVYRLALATTAEVEAAVLYWSDRLHIDLYRRPIMEWSFTLTFDVTGGSGLPASGDTIHMGLASARNATPLNTTYFDWIRFGTAADRTIRLENDDNVTQISGKSSGYTITSGRKYFARIDCRNLSDVQHFIFDCTAAGRSPRSARELTKLKRTDGGLMPLAAITTAGSALVQPIFEVAKANAANNDHRLDIDFVSVSWDRA